MNMRSSWIWGTLLAALMVGLVAVPEADAKGARGGHSGGRSMRAPHVSSNMRAFKAPTYKAPRMPHAAAPARTNTAHSKTARTNTARTNTSQARANNTQTHASRAATTGTANSATTGGTRATRTASTSTSTSTNTSPNSYTYGSGTGARRYRANSYGQGYRNRYNGGRSGYGRSQGNNRAIVSRLRSVHSNLARIDHDYRGHRVRAMHAVSMAIRQLSHRSMVSSNMGFGAGGNNAMAMGMRRGGGAGVGGGAGNGGGRRNQPMNQNQSDSRMSHALRTLQGISMQMSNQGSTTTAGHGRARGHVQRAVHELNTALSIR